MHHYSTIFNIIQLFKEEGRTSQPQNFSTYPAKDDDDQDPETDEMYKEVDIIDLGALKQDHKINMMDSHFFD